jgi:hypothetical protein
MMSLDVMLFFCYFLGFSAISFGQYKLIQIADKYDKSI